MTLFPLRNDSCKGFISEPSPHSRLTRLPSQITSTLAVVAAVIFTLASGATNLLYGLAKGVDLPSSLVWGSVAVGASIGLALAPSAFLLSLSAKRYMAAVVSVLAIVVFGAYSVTAALGSASGGRMVAASDATEIVSSRSRHQAAYDIGRSELDRLPSARPLAELHANIEAIDRLPGIVIDGVPCGGTLNGKVTKEWCPKRSELAAEMARAERREKLQADMGRATAELSKLPAARVANTDAAALAGYLTAVGHPLSTDALNRLLVGLAVMVIEFGGGLSLALAMALRMDGHQVSALQGLDQQPGAINTKPDVKVSAPVEMPAAQARPMSASAPKKKPKRTRRKDKGGKGGSASGGHRRTRVNVVDLLMAQGGRIDGGQRGIGKLLGVGKSRANELLHELAAAGAVILSTSKSGTTVQLAAAG